jgi:uncharacterized membrane protein YheB (UPF0754 family)
MAKVSKGFKEQIAELSRKDLENIIIKIAGKEQSVFDYIQVNYLDKEFGEQELYEKTLDKIRATMQSGARGILQKSLAKEISLCRKHIKEFTDISKNKVLETELVRFVVNFYFKRYKKHLGTCFTTFDSNLGSMLKRLITLVTKHLHPDLLEDYREELTAHLKAMRTSSYHLDDTYNL